ncbi:MAG: glycosyltransferase family 39 protein [Acidobacteriota bacterium]
MGEGSRIVGLAARLALPAAAVLGIGAQALLARKDLGSQGVAAGALLYVLAGATLLLPLLRGRAAQGAARAEDRGAPAAPPRAAPAALEWALVALVVAGGLYLRVYRIDLFPPGLNNDEAINALEAAELGRSKPFATLTERGLHRETMFHALAALSFRNPEAGLNLLRAMPAVFGTQERFLKDPLMERTFPLRAVSIAVGAMTVLAIYLFGRGWLGWRVGLLAALFLAVSPWHLLYSRVGLRAILAPLFALASVGLFLRALRTGRPGDHVAWGLLLGLGLWSYTAFRAVPVALAAFLLLRRLLGPGRWGQTSARRAHLLTGAGIAAALLLLIVVLSGIGPRQVLLRGAYAAQQPPGANRWLNLFHALTMVNYFPARFAVIQSDSFIGDGVSAVYGLAGREPEGALVAALATLGILSAAIGSAGRRRDAASDLILLCIMASVLTVGLAGPSLTRMLIVLPWLCLLAAAFVWRVYGRLAALRPPLTAWFGAVVVAAIAVFASWQGFVQMFQVAGGSETALKYFWPRQTVMGMFVRSQPPGPVFYVLHSYGRETLTYLIGDRPDVYLTSDPATLDLDGIARMPRTVSFVVEYSEYSRPFAEVLRYLMTRYPQGDMTQVADGRFDPDEVRFYTFTLWKDGSGRVVSPPGSFPGPEPGGMSFPAPAPGGTPPP